MEFLAFLFVAVVILLVIVLARVSNLSNKISVLQWEIKKLEGRVDHFESSPPPKPKSQPTPQPPPVRTPAVTPAVAVTKVPGPVLALPPVTPSRTREEWESLIGGKVLNRIGAFALILGVGFFLKYAFDNNWISETVRVLIGCAIGLVCLAAAYRAHQKDFRVFAQGIVGAGISILYLSVFAAFNFYALVPQWVAFILMAIVTALTLAQGLYYNSIAVALLGWAGGFLTPIMLSTGQANEVGLFTYLILLDTALLSIYAKRTQWWALEPLTFAGTWILYLSWYVEYYTLSDVGITIPFVAVFWALFLASTALQPHAHPAASVFKRVVAGANAWVVFWAIYALLDPKHHAWISIVTLFIGLVYLGILSALSSRERLSERDRVQHALTSIVFLVLATAIEWNGFEIVIAWSVEAAGLMWIASRLRARHVWLSATALFGLVALKFIGTRGSLLFGPLDEFSLLLHLRSYGLIVAAASLALGASLLNRVVEGRDRWIVTTLRVLWPFSLFLLIGLETNDFFRAAMLNVSGDMLDYLMFKRFMWMGILWAVYSLPLAYIGFKRVPVLVCGFMAALVGGGLILVRGVVFDPMSEYAAVFNIRAAAFFSVIIVLLVLERLSARKEHVPDWLPDVRSAVQMALMVVIFGLLTSEVRDVFRKQMASLAEGEVDHMSTLSNLQQISLSGTWLLYSVVLMGAGLWRKLRGLRVAAFVLFGVTILKIFLYDLSFLDTLYRIFSFIGLGLVLLAVSFAYQKYRDVIFGTRKS